MFVSQTVMLRALHLHAGCQRYLSETGRKKNKEEESPP